MRAAESILALAVPLEPLIEGKRLTEIPGVGDAIGDIITKRTARVRIRNWRSSARNTAAQRAGTGLPAAGGTMMGTGERARASSRKVGQHEGFWVVSQKGML